MRRHTRFDNPHPRTIDTRLSVGTDFAVYTNVHHKTNKTMKGLGTALITPFCDNGSIDYSSKLGKGTKVVVKLPIVVL